MAEPISSFSDFTVRRVDRFAVVVTPDEIDIGNAVRFRAALLAAANHELPGLIVDMTGTEFCDSTGLSVLVGALRQQDQSGGEIRLVVGGTALRRILAVTGVVSLFSVYHSVDEALGVEPGDAD
jgi:anti-sigma B factor antagonist